MSDPIDELAARRVTTIPNDDFDIEVGWQDGKDGRVVALVDHHFQIINLLNAAQARAVAKLLFDAADICEQPTPGDA